MTSALSTEEGPFDQQPASILARILALVLAVFCVLALGFYYMGARYYEPVSGRFISPDPLGHASSMGLYDYANGDPVNGLDPDGRCSSVSNYGGYSGSYGTKTWSDQLNEAAYVGMHPGKTADISSIPLTYKQDPIDWGQVVDQVANLITRAPVISTIRAATELITGRDLISGQHIYAGDAFQNLMISAALDATLLMPEVRGVAAMGEVGVTRTASNVMRSPLRMAPIVAESSVRSNVLANIAESQAARASSGFAQASRRWTALDVYEQTGWSSARIESHLSGIDFSKPVSVMTLPAGNPVAQAQIPGAPLGNYFAPVGTPMNTLGIYPVGRVSTLYAPVQSTQVLKSTAATVMDTWSVPGRAIPASGGGTQYFSPTPGVFRRLP